MITYVDNLYANKNGSGSCKKKGTVSFSAARYLTMLAASEKRVSVNMVKRNLDREAKKIKNSGADSAQISRALQKIKYVMRKADEKVALLNREERNKARLKRAEIADKKEEAKRLKKISYVEKYFRKSNEHGNIVRAALVEKGELNESDFSGFPSGENIPQVPVLPSEATMSGSGTEAKGSLLDIMA